MMIRELFDRAIGDAPPARIDLDQMVNRQRRAARLRSGAAAVAGVAVLAVAAGVVTQVGGDTGGDDAVPALELQPGADPLAGFPEYLQGTRVVAATGAPTRDTLTLTFTPESPDLVLFLRCEDHGLPSGYELRSTVSAGDLTAHEASCLTDIPLWDDEEQSDFWQLTGVEVGEPVTVAASLTAAHHTFDGDAPELEVPEPGTFAMAVAEVVPFEEYQLPPAPDVVKPLPEPVTPGTVARSDATDPLAPVEITLRWDTGLAGCDPDHGRVYPLELVSQTPGVLRVFIDDVEVTAQTWWDYQQATRIAELEPACGAHEDGDEVTLRVEPAQVTGDWQVVVNGAGG